MKTIAEINAKVENIKRTKAQVEAQIAEKQVQVENLKKSNSRLVELSLGKERKSASLQTQRQRIFNLNSEVEELKFVQGRLDKELEQAKQELSEASIHNRIAEYRKAEIYHINLINKAQESLNQFVKDVEEIEGLQGRRNALEQLLGINGDLNGKKLSDYGIGLSEVLSKFSHTVLSCNFDFSRIENINLSLQNLINQLDAVCKGKRGFHKVQTRLAQTVQKVPHHVDPLHQARLYEKQRLESRDDLSKAMKGKTQIIQHNHR